MTLRQLRHWAFGRALRTRESVHQTIGKTVGLAVFASDSLSSVAYAGGEILLILAVLGATYYWLSIPITVAISGLLIILTLSYRQTIFAYPSGGGAYIVARDNFGEQAAQVAGAALLVDYILTVAVSISSGVDQIASMFPVLFNYKVQIALLLILFITLMNLRGVKESGRVFAVPTYWFVGMMLLLIGTGLAKAVFGQLGTVTDVPGVDHTVENLTGFAFVFLLLRAFSSGTTAVTGVEAISNGITAFKPPKSRNAAITLMWDASLLMIMFLGLGVLGYLAGAQPSEQEVLISQVARTVYGEGLLQFITLLSAMVILIMAANTSFADFPRLAALQAGDGFLPRQFTFRGSRLVFSWGVILLAAFASLLIIVFQGSVSRLIPLYAIGVFISFTLSQSGMARRWLKTGRLMYAGKLTPETEIPTLGSILHYDRHWMWKMLLNGFGAVITSIVAIIFLVTKFLSGAWIVVILMPFLVWLFDQIHGHYKRVATILSTAGETFRGQQRPVETIILVGDVHRETMRLVEFANSLGVPWKGVHIAVNEERVAEVQRKWQERVGIGELVILRSPYRSLTRPLYTYVRKRLRQNPGGYIHLVMGELRTGSPLSQLLHQNAHIIEQLALSDLDGVVTTLVPFPLEKYAHLSPDAHEEHHDDAVQETVIVAGQKEEES
ncbi:MAG: APC family permease [Caldilineaceae bacterium]|nr:APC family permease [Caldilineaceae bacterium]